MKTAAQTSSNSPNAMPTVPGLDYLASMDRILVKQNIEMLELVLDLQSQNSYQVCNDVGVPIFIAAEDSNCCIRYLWGYDRSFTMNVYDMDKNHIMRVYRPLVPIPALFCFPCCLNSIQVFAPPDEFIGSVKRKLSIYCVYFSVYNAEGEKILYIEGPLCPQSCVCKSNFKVYDATTGQQIGKIQKKFSGFLRELMTDADNFGITFPRELDVKTKAILLGVTFLIDFMYFES